MPPQTPPPALTAQDLARARAKRRRLRRVYVVFAYASFLLWVFGLMLTIFSKGITLPGESLPFGSPESQLLLLLALICTLVAALGRIRLERLQRAHAELVKGVTPPMP